VSLLFQYHRIHADGILLDTGSSLNVTAVTNTETEVDINLADWWLHDSMVIIVGVITGNLPINTTLNLTGESVQP